MHEALINGAVLRWARERQDLGISELAAATKISEKQLSQWESGAAHPPFGRAELLSAKLKVPFGYFFLKEPPRDELPIRDFRTRKGDSPARPSANLLSVIEHARRKQEWYREFSQDTGAIPPRWVGSIRTTDTIAGSAERLVDIFGINSDLRMAASGASSFLTRLSEAAQDVGVLVLRSGIAAGSRKALKPDEFQGFALADDWAPLIFINSRDAYTAQVFTLVHELVHLSLAQSGVSLADPVSEQYDPVETFCNKVAAESLLPTTTFIDSWRETGRPDYLKVSRGFHVSPLVVLRRAFDLALLDRETFFKLVATEKGKSFTARKSKGGDAIRTLLSRNSLRFTSAVLTALRDNHLSYRDAARLLGTRLSGLDALVRKRVA